MKTFVLSVLLSFLSIQVVISQDLFNKEIDFSNLLMPKFLGIFSPITLERIKGERNYECYYMIFHIEDGEIASVEFSDNIHPRYLERYNESYLEDVRERICKEEIRFEKDCKIYVPVLKVWKEPTEHTNRIEEVMDWIFPSNQTFDCLHISKPLVITTWNVI
jgi:hypothetical protein